MRLLSSRGPLGAIMNHEPIEGRNVVKFDAAKVLAWLDKMDHEIDIMDTDDVHHKPPSSSQAAELR
jgi:hypothetical protein